MRHTMITLAAFAAAAAMAIPADGQPAAESVAAVTQSSAQAPQSAVFAGGDFRALQAAFEAVYGIISVTAGYTGGAGAQPKAKDYAAHGYLQAVEVSWDPSRVGYRDLLEVYWRHVDPTDAGGQFADRGPQYRPVVFWNGDQQKAAAEASRAALEASGRFHSPIVVDLERALPFYTAGDAEQDFAARHPDGYRSLLESSGRTAFLAKAWGTEALTDPAAPPTAENGAWRKPAESELRARLSALEFEVTQRDGTEAPFDNVYWNNHEPGIYVDIVSGEPLFSSTDKFESGTGWPSFTRPLAPTNIVLREDDSLGMVRVEVRSRYADSHLGHLFDDGPPPTGLRYCMDSAALRFVPVADMQHEGYGRWLWLFQGKRNEVAAH